MSKQNHRQDVVQRMAARLLRANEAGIVILGPKERPDCVTALTVGFITPGTRKSVVEYWLAYSPYMREAGWEDPRPRPAIDARIAATYET